MLAGFFTLLETFICIVWASDLFLFYTSLVVLETAVSVLRLLETEILQSWSWSWSIGLGCFWDRSI